MLLADITAQNRPELELLVRLLVVRLLAREGDLAEYAEACEHALAACRQVGVDLLTYIGSSQFRLGLLHEAIESYKSALRTCSKSDGDLRWGQIAMGLGWTFLQVGNIDDAINTTKQAVSYLRRENGLNYCMAYHNLAIMESKRTNWERACVILSECVVRYRQLGRPDKEASVLENIAFYWLSRANLDRADEICWTPLEILDQDDNPVLRGRIHRLLGRIAAQQGAIRQAQQYCRISLDLHRRVQALAEAAETEELLRGLQGRSLPSQGNVTVI
jgi:tetratricopeptide (TPR) repeat protein